MSGGDGSHRVNPSERGPDCWSEVNWGAQLADFKQMQYHQSLLWLALVELLVEKGIVTREEVREAARELNREVTAMPIRKEGKEAGGQFPRSRREEEKEE